jgi:hypothetical protein
VPLFIVLMRERRQGICLPGSLFPVQADLLQKEQQTANHGDDSKDGGGYRAKEKKSLPRVQPQAHACKKQHNRNNPKREAPTSMDPITI